MATRTISKKAAEVRESWVEKKRIYLTHEAEKVFDWFLDLIFANIKEDYLSPFEVYLADNETEIKFIRPNHPIETYCLTGVLQNIDRDSFFKVLKTTVENEEGYKATISNEFWDSGLKAIVFKIVIK